MVYLSSRALFLLSLSLLTGCGDGGSGPGGSGDGGSGPGGATGDGGSGSAPNGDDECGISGATWVAEKANYYSDSVIIRMTVAGSRLLFGTLDQIYSVPTSGGEPTLVYPPEPVVDIYPPFWVLDDELVVGRAQSLDVFSVSGGPLRDSRELVERFSSNLSGTSDILLAPDGNTFYAKYDPIVLTDDEPSITYFKYDYENDESSSLLSDTAIGHQKRVVLSGDALFTAQREGDVVASASDPTSDTLHKIPVDGGAAVEVPVTGSFKMDLVGADDDDLYFAGRPAPLDITADPGGFYRISRSGGAPEQIIREYITQTSAISDFIIEGDRAIVWYLGKIFSVPLGSGEGELLFSTGCQIHAIAVDGEDLFLSIFDESDESAGVLSVPLP